MKLIFFISVFFISLLFPYNNRISAQEENPEKVRIIYFYAENCSNCEIIEPFIEEITKEYDNKIEFIKHDVRKKEECRQLFFHFASTYNVPAEDAKTPIIFIGKDYLFGVSNIKNNLKEKIDIATKNNESLLFDCHEFLDAWPNVDKIDFVGGDGGDDGCSINLDTQCIIEENNRIDQNRKLSLTLIITTAIIDSINPCAIAVLIFLLGILLSLKSSRKKIIKIGLVYIGAVFITYYLAGLGIIRIITQFDIAKEIAIFAGVIVLFAGFIEIKEGIYPDGKQILRIPEKSKPIFTSFLKKGTIPSVFIAGVLVSAFELPCTGQVYLGILSMLSQESLKTEGYAYLFIYNLIFVLPLVIILLIAAWGFNIKRMEKMRKKTRMTVKLLMGLVMILLGLFLLYQDQIIKMFVI
ncbi:MAG: cytochrome c biogenesis CcdA family protein [Patescibacteria group bacterium]|nr:cytochrome c biogenesis CcdA family protein [Patescibacteria group bacterium]